MTLRELLAHRKATQADLAERLGVSQQMVSKWVRGTRDPKIETALKIAGALDAFVRIVPGAKWEYIPQEEHEPTQPTTQEDLTR